MLIDKIRLNFNAKALYEDKHHSYQNILLENVRILADYISGKSKTLEFDIPNLELIREDSTELRDKILIMTPEERKRLNLRRNTLWYMKKHIKEGKRIKVYRKVLTKIS